MPTATMKIRHLVLLQLSSDISGANEEALKRDLTAIASSHPNVSFGMLLPDLKLVHRADRHADWFLELHFHDEKSFQAYIDSELHQQFLQNYEPLCERILSIQVR